VNFDIASYLRAALEDARWDVLDLWIAACGIGGALEEFEVAQVAAGSRLASQAEYDVLAAALNGHFHDLGLAAPVLYWAELPAA
jgi:hypothetical protein